MSVGKIISRTFAFSLLVYSLLGAFAPTVAGPVTAPPLASQTQAVQEGNDLERSREYLKAVELYERALEQWPDNSELKYGLRRSKIHFGIERRYSDSSFLNSLLSQPRHEALQLFDEVLQKVKSHYVNPLSSTSFVAHGTESLYLALENERFLKKHLPAANQTRIRQLRRTLRDEYWNKPVGDTSGARQMVERVAELARTTLGLSATTVIMEYVFGGCNALDDYSNFLTADRLDDLYDNIDGEFVGLGIEMKAEMGKGLLLVHVLPESPAAEGGVQPGEHIVSIDGTSCRYMTTDEAAGLLRGPSGSRVRLELVDDNRQATRHAMLTRREVQVKSFPIVKMIDPQNGIGYIQMSGFQKTSSLELDAALRTLKQQGLRALIWDLRRNPGGLLTAAVEVLDRFIDRGTLVSTKGRTADQNWNYSAHRTGTNSLPLVLLTDGDSASASEIVAGAIRDHRRGVIVGRRTYGKWSVQSIFPIHGSTGLRITTAKFYSPNGETLGKIGVHPHVAVKAADVGSAASRPPSQFDPESDADIQKALEVLRSQMASQ